MATFYTGNSGRSTGPHLDYRVWSHEAGDYVDPSAFKSYVTSGEGGLDQFRVTDTYGSDRGSYRHQGIDYATEIDTPINVNGRYLTTFNDEKGGISNQYEIEHDGKKFDIILMHGSDKNNVLSEGAVTDGVSLLPGTPGANADVSEVTPQQKAKEKAQAWKAFTAADVVEGFGNDFGSMKSSRLGDALAGAQESIVKKRFPDENFGGRMVTVDEEED